MPEPHIRGVPFKQVSSAQLGFVLGLYVTIFNLKQLGLAEALCFLVHEPAA